MPATISDWVTLIASVTALVGVVISFTKAIRISKKEDAEAVDLYEQVAARSATRISTLMDEKMALEQELKQWMRGANLLSIQLRGLGETPCWDIFEHISKERSQYDANGRSSKPKGS
jgi:hypothetical protein